MKHFFFWLTLMTILVNQHKIGMEYNVWPWIVLLGVLDFIRFPSNLR